MAATDVVIRFIGDASKVQSTVSEVEGTGSKLKSWAKGIGAAIGAAVVVNQVQDFVGAAEEADVASSRLAQTLKNAGDATGAWDKRAESLATTLMNKTGIDDEVIKGGQAILATFHSVSDASAQQAGIFDRATASAVDLSKAGFGDVDSAAKQLGKALEDPVKGIGALAKAGVNFTQQQKDQIAVLVATGDKLGAQKIIMGEVEGQVGGVAEKTATASDKMRVAWGETQEALGHALLPVLQALAPPLQKIAQFVQQSMTWLVPLVAAIAGVVAGIKAWAIVQAIINAELWANPVGVIIAAIVALIAIIVLVVKNWDTIAAAAEAAWGAVLDIVLAVWNGIKDAAAAAWEFVLGAIRTVWEWIQDNWPLLLAILTGPFGIAVALIVSNWDSIKGFFSGLIGAIGNIVGRASGT